MANREFEYSKMVEFAFNMQIAMNAYHNHEYENALHNALNALDDALYVYLAIVNDYPYNERQYNFAREMRNMIDREHMRIESDFDKGDTAENE